MHDLDITQGVASFVTARKPAWHRLGTVFDRLLTAEEALVEGHLAGWKLRKLDTTATEIDDNGVGVYDVPDTKAVARTNPITGKTEILGSVGRGFHHVQNEEQVEFLQALIDEGGAFIETAGALRGGRQVFFTARLPHDMLIGGVDRVALYMAALNGHDGSMAFKSICTPTRIVCANTQNAAINNAEQTWSRRHTRNVVKAVEEARRSLNLTFKFAEAFELEAERMIQKELTEAKFEEIISKIYKPVADGDTDLQARRKVERLGKVRELFHDADTQANIRGTNWAAYQAVGEFEDWFTTVRGSDANLRRAQRSVDGDAVKIKNKAFGLLKVPAKV